MSREPGEMEPRDDVPEDDEEERLDQEERRRELLGQVPDVYWAEDLAKTESLALLEQGIRDAQRLKDKREELSRRHDAGEISDSRLSGDLMHLRKEESRAATRAGIGSVGLSYDHLGDVSENYDLMLRDLNKAEPSLLESKDRVKKAVEEMGSQAARDLADEMLERGEIGQEAHRLITRQARLGK